ncbi:MAG: GAF domain-containing protein [Deltaproteobacteria bacterium]|nr:GAF domain-containing protein [Deltaproteobacteria bacterium]
MSRSRTDDLKLQSHEEEIRKFKILQEIQKKIGAERSIDKLLPLIISEISELMDADRTSIFLVDWNTLDLRARFSEGVANDSISIKLRMGIVGWSVLSKQVVNITNAYEHPYFNPDIDQILDYKTESILVAPVQDDEGQILGALEMLNKDIGCFNDADMALIRDQAQMLGRKEGLSVVNMPAGKAKEVIEKLAKQTSCERGSFFIVDRNTNQLKSLFALGLEENDINLNLKLGIAGFVAVSGQVLNIEDALQDERFDSSIDKITGYKTNTILALPLIDHSGETIGVLEVINKKKGVFNESDIQILKGLSSIVAIAIVNAMMFAEQEKQFQSILEVMAASIDAKDNLTAGHSINVTHLAMGIAAELGFNDSEVDVIRTAGLLHDYGKLGIDDQVLKKPGKLNEEEYEHIKQHVRITRNILDKMFFARKYRNVPIIASSHHELLDGSGYDRGSTSKEISFMSKIITVADVFEALTADRHYRPAMPTEKAISILEDGVTGGKFDGNIVNALKSYLVKNDYQINKMSKDSQYMDIVY